MKSNGTNIHAAFLLVAVIIGAVAFWNHRSATEALGVVTVISHPEQATVYLDGKDVGQTPTVVKGITPGLRRIAVQKAGYDMYNGLLNFMPKQRTEFEVYLSDQAIEVGPSFSWHLNTPRGSLVTDKVLIMASSSGKIVAVDRGTKHLLWSQELPDSTIVSKPIIIDDVLVVACYDGSLYGFDHRSGDLLWERELDFRVSTVITSEKGGIALGANRLAHFGSTGEVDWITSIEGNVLQSSLSLQESSLTGVTKEGAVFRIPFATGHTSILQELHLGSTMSMYLLEALISEGQVALVNSRGHLGLIDIRNTTETKTKDLGIGDLTLVRFEDNVLLLASERGVMRAINSQTRETLWNTNLLSSISTVLALDGLLVVGCADGSLFVLDGQSGEVMARKQFTTQIASIHGAQLNELDVTLRNGTVHSVKLPF